MSTYALHMDAEVYYLDNDRIKTVGIKHFYPNLRYCRRELKGDERMLKFLSLYIREEISLCDLLGIQQFLIADNLRDSLISHAMKWSGSLDQESKKLLLNKSDKMLGRRFNWTDDAAELESCAVWVSDWELQCCGQFSFALGETVEWLICKPIKESQQSDPWHYDYLFDEHDDKHERMFKLIGDVAQIHASWGKLIPEPGDTTGKKRIWSDESKHVQVDKADGWEEGGWEEDADGFRFTGYHVKLKGVRIAPAKKDEIKMTDKEYTQKMEADVDVYSLDDKAFAAYAEEVGERFSKAGEDLIETLKELDKTIEGRTARVVKRMFEMFDTPEEAIAALLSSGYTKDGIRESGYDV